METAPLEAGYRSQSRSSMGTSPAGIRIDIPPPPNLPWGGSNYDNSRFYTAKGYLPPETEPVSEQPTPSSQTSSHSGALPSPAGSRVSEGKPQVAGVQPSLRASATLGTLMEQLGSEAKVGPPPRQQYSSRDDSKTPLWAGEHRARRQCAQVSAAASACCNLARPAESSAVRRARCACRHRWRLCGLPAGSETCWIGWSGVTAWRPTPVAPPRWAGTREGTRWMREMAQPGRRLHRSALTAASHPHAIPAATSSACGQRQHVPLAAYGHWQHVPLAASAAHALSPLFAQHTGFPFLRLWWYLQRGCRAATAQNCAHVHGIHPAGAEAAAATAGQPAISHGCSLCQCGGGSGGLQDAGLPVPRPSRAEAAVPGGRGGRGHDGGHGGAQQQGGARLTDRSRGCAGHGQLTEGQGGELVSQHGPQQPWWCSGAGTGWWQGQGCMVDASAD